MRQHNAENKRRDSGLRSSSQRKKVVLVLALLACVLIAAGVTSAYLTSTTQSEENVFDPAYVSCEVVEEFNGNVKKDVKIKNTSNIEAYIRVRLVSHLVNKEGQIIPGEVKYPDIVIGSWFKQGEYYYHKSPVLAGEDTDELISEFMLAINDDGSTQALEILAEAIQSVPAGAVEGKWDVKIDPNSSRRELLAP